MRRMSNNYRTMYTSIQEIWIYIEKYENKELENTSLVWKNLPVRDRQQLKKHMLDDSHDLY